MVIDLPFSGRKLSSPYHISRATILSSRRRVKSWLMLSKSLSWLVNIDIIGVGVEIPELSKDPTNIGLQTPKAI